MIIDFHVHIIRREFHADEILEAYLEPLKELEALLPRNDDELALWSNSENDHERLLESMDASGIDVSVALPIDWGMIGTTHATLEHYMDWLFEGCQSHDRIIPFMGLDPRRPDARELLDRICRRWEPKGMKVYPPTGFRPDDPDIRWLWDELDDRSMIVVSHTGAAWGPLYKDLAHPKYFDPVAEAHPDLVIVLAHLGGEYHDEMWDVVERHDNIYTDISALQGWLPRRRDMVLQRLRSVAERIPERALLGTDWALFELNYPNQLFMNWLRDEDWASPSVSNAILGGNAQRILGL